MDNIYRDIAGRTGGDIYIGVVGPVRTGKSTFIKKFMEALVLPNIEGEYDRRRARDEMPQSGAGKAVMTTEPKFIPDEAVNITVDGDATLRVKMVDCVGYIVPDATGQTENGEPRMVLTPWSASPMPFPAAAEMGTRKVITDHATIGVVVTTDGSIGDIPRESYADAERRVVEELRSIAKPFAIVLNSADPAKPEAEALAYELESRYGVPVALVNCLELNADDIRHILELILLEFPVTEISVGLPRWTAALEADHWLSASLRAAVLECAGKITRTGDIRSAFAPLAENENIESARVSKLDLSSGQAELDIKLDEGLYYRVMSELTGFSIPNEEELISLMRRLAEIKTAYDKVAGALADVASTGYGIVTPDISDMHLDEPEIVRESGGWGIRLKAGASSIHMIRADIDTEINPIVGTQPQAEELVRYLTNTFEDNPGGIWECGIFGKTMHELVTDSIHQKLQNLPAESRVKLSETLRRIINEGSGGLICIIL